MEALVYSVRSKLTASENVAANSLGQYLYIIFNEDFLLLKEINKTELEQRR